MTKRIREEEQQLLEDAKEPWFFWGLEQQRWIDAFIAHMREHPVTDVPTFELGVTIWPDITVPPTIAPSWKIVPHVDSDGIHGRFFRVTMATSLWNELRSGFFVFSREVVVRVVEALPEYQYQERRDDVRYEEITKFDYAKCIVDLKRVASEKKEKK